MCVPNLMPENPMTAPRQSQPSDAIPKPDSLKGVQKLEDFHKARAMARQRLGIISSLAGGGLGGPGTPQAQSGGGGGGGGPSMGR